MVPPLRWIRQVLWYGLSFCLIVAPLRAATPTGPEIPISPPSTVLYTSVSMLPDGSFLAAWEDFSETSGGSYGQRFDVGGSPVGQPFLVASVGGWPSAALTPAGDFVVAFHRGDSNGLGIFARRFGADATPLGTAFQVSTTTMGDQQYPVVRAAPDGSFVVVWLQWDGGMMGQRFDPAGSPAGGEFSVSQGFAGYDPSLAVAPDGSFVVAWSGLDASVIGVFARKFEANGTPIGDEFLVNTYTTNIQAWPDVAMNPSGDFVITWHSKFQDESGDGVFAQRYDAQGATLGGEFQVNDNGSQNESYPEVSVDEAGNFVVLWSAPDADLVGVYGRSFDALGSPMGPSFQVNTYTTGFQGGLRKPLVSAGQGRFLATWEARPSQISARWLDCQSFPDEISGLSIAHAGADLVMSWAPSPGAENYHVLEDVSPDGGFHNSVADGVTGATVAMPEGNRFYLVAGRNDSCGFGPRR